LSIVKNASNILLLSNSRLKTSMSIGLLRVRLSARWQIATIISSSLSAQMPSTPPSILSSSNYDSAICDARSIIWRTVSDISWSKINIISIEPYCQSVFLYRTNQLSLWPLGLQQSKLVDHLLRQQKKEESRHHI